MALEIVVSVVLLFFGIALLVVIHICVVQRLFMSQHENGDLALDSSQGQRRGSSNPNISLEELNRLPCFDHVVEVGRGGMTSNSADCAVCLESFKGGEKCRSLPDCGHYFHAQCIDSWLLKTPICPICRASINSPGIS